LLQIRIIEWQVFAAVHSKPALTWIGFIFPVCIFFSVLRGWFSLNIDSKEFIGNMEEKFFDETYTFKHGRFTEEGHRDSGKR